MTEVTQLNSGHTWRTPTARVLAPVPRRHIKKIFAPAMVILALVLTVAWVAFLGWCVLRLSEGLLAPFN